MKRYNNTKTFTWNILKCALKIANVKSINYYSDNEK